MDNILDDYDNICNEIDELEEKIRMKKYEIEDMEANLEKLYAYRKELGEKIVEEVEVVDANAAYDEAEDNAYEEEEEFAIADEEVYNNEDSKNEEQLEEEEYEEGTMPAIELPDSKDN